MPDDLGRYRGNSVLDHKQPIETGPVPEDGSQFDVIVVGGGPGGSAAAAFNAMNGCKVLLIEKGIWPRDKPCGDAVGGKSLSHAKELGVLELIDESPHYVVDSIVFGSANGSEVRVMLPKEAYEKQGLQSGYSLPREQFDYLMFHKCQDIVRENGGSVIQGFTVTEVNVEGEGIEACVTGVKGNFGRDAPDELEFNSALTIGAGGYNCPVSRTITLDVFDEPHRDDDHFCGGYREYWDNVEGLEGNEGQIEIHFVDEVIPGYFWLFPVGDGVVNVGIGMLISEERKAKKKGGWRGLKKTQEWLIREHPRFKERFANATMVSGSGKGWQLPFGSPRKNPPSHQPRRGAMAGAMTVGDAASLVDPFSGEGIGNALLSAKLTSKHFDKNLHSSGFPSEAADAYMEELWAILGKELTNSKTLQKMMKWKRLTNWFINKANRKKEIGTIMSEMIASKEAQTELWNPWFLFKTIVLP